MHQQILVHRVHFLSMPLTVPKQKVTGRKEGLGASWMKSNRYHYPPVSTRTDITGFKSTYMGRSKFLTLGRKALESEQWKTFLREPRHTDER